MQANRPSPATRPTRSLDCNRSAVAGFAGAHGLPYSNLLWSCWSNARYMPRVGSTALAEMLSCLTQTQLAIWAAAHKVCVVVFLSVVLPRADGTQLETAALTKRARAAAWAT